MRTLAQYDAEVGTYLKDIEHYARMCTVRVASLQSLPGFVTKAEARLIRCEGALLEAYLNIRLARAGLQAKQEVSE